VREQYAVCAHQSYLDIEHIPRKEMHRTPLVSEVIVWLSWILGTVGCLVVVRCKLERPRRVKTLSILSTGSDVQVHQKARSFGGGQFALLRAARGFSFACRRAARPFYSKSNHDADA
jgi:hypothetical protein